MAAIQSGSSCHIILQPDGIRLAAKAHLPLPTLALPALNCVLTIELPLHSSAEHKDPTIPPPQKMSAKSVSWVSFGQLSTFQP